MQAGRQAEKRAPSHSSRNLPNETAQVEEWNSFTSACTTCFRAAFGKFDFMAIYTVSPALAIVWFWTFMLTMAMVLFNLILGIVTLTFSLIHAQYGDSPPFGKQMLIIRREQLVLAAMSLFPGVTRRRLPIFFLTFILTFG